MRQTVGGGCDNEVRKRCDLIAAQIDIGQEGLIKQAGRPGIDTCIIQVDRTYIRNQAEVGGYTQTSA